MGFFSNTIAALAKGQAVRCARLVDFEFIGDRTRVWEGFGPITVDGFTWLGSGDLASISDLPFGENDAAGSVTFTLSGVSPDIVALARNGDNVRGQPVTVYGQFFDEAMQPLDPKFTLAMLYMDVMTYAGMGPTDRRISLTAETIWTNRNAAAFAYFSDADQQERFPGDKGLERVFRYTGGVRVEWPKFS